MAAAEVEYTVVRLVQHGKDHERKQVDELNGFAERGWRLIAVSDHIAYFERPTQ